MKVLITAFEPFDGRAKNSALETLRAIDFSRLDAQVITQEVPTVFGQALEITKAVIKAEEPQIVVSLGEAGGRMAISLERLAINLDDARIPDNKGQQPQDQTIVPGGPAAYFSSLPLKAMQQAIQALGLPAEISNTAGTFVCNHLMYGVLDYLAETLPQSQAGFIHIPYLTDQVAGSKLGPSMALADTSRAILAALETAIDNY